MDRRKPRKKLSKTQLRSQSFDEPLPSISGSIPQTNGGATARIIIQPASKSFRFRYKCDGRTGCIPGVSQQSDDIQTYPTIEIIGHNGPAQVIVSCVETEKPYRCHPHHLVSRNFCENGYCRKSIAAGETIVPFNFGIQVCKIHDAKDSLELRERMNIDPFRAGFDHKNNISSINMKAVRLCFQVYIKQDLKYIALPPLLSHVIFDSRSVNEFLIREISHCSGPMAGGMRMILLCNDLGKESLRVTFFEEQNGTTIWEKDATIVEIFKRVAIVLKIPKYRDECDEHVSSNAQVHFQLRKSGDESNAVPFEYIAPNMDCDYLRRKRQKTLSPLLLDSPLPLEPFATTSSFDVSAQPFIQTSEQIQQWLPQFQSSVYEQPSTSTSQNWSSELLTVQHLDISQQQQTVPTVPTEQTTNYVYFSQNNQNYVSLEPNQNINLNIQSSHQTAQMSCDIEDNAWMLPDLSPEIIEKVLKAFEEQDSKEEKPRTCRDGEVESLSDRFSKNKI